MKSFLLSSLCLAFSLVPFFSFGQNCANQITVTSGGVTVGTANNGQSGTSYPVCPTAGGQYTFSGSSTSNAVLTWARVVTAGATTGTDVVTDAVTSTNLAGVPLNITVSPTAATTYRFESNATCGGGKDLFVYFKFDPTLTLAADAAGLAGLCAGGSTTLTASGSTSGTYTWAANGVTIPNQTSSTLTVSPLTTTTYTVTAVTSCGTSSQQITVLVKDVTISPSAPVVCSGQGVSLTASYSGSNATYTWTVVGGNGTTISPASTTATSSTIGVNPVVTTTYKAVATTDCGTITKQVTVTVSSAVTTASVSPTTSTICSGSSTTLTATSNYTSPTYAWKANGVAVAGVTGNTYTVNPSVNTTYTVTATTTCGGTSAAATATVNVAAAATFAVSPAGTTSTVPFAICSGTSTTLTASSNISNATYQWYNAASPGVLISTSPSLTITPVVTTTTTYQYNVFTTTSCGTSTQSVYVKANPSVSVSPTSALIAKGNSTTLTANGATNYTWSPATGLSATNVAVVTASPTVTTTYTVTGSVTATAPCSNTASVTVTVAAPLPVALTSFEATRMGSYPVITWSTASEQNSHYFEVERSVNGTDFTAIVRIAAQGNKARTSAYSYRDATEVPQANLLYYRLHQVDVDGTAAYSSVRTVAMSSAPTDLIVFPNPAHGAAKLVGAAAIAPVQVLDALGRMVFVTTTNAAGTAILALPTGLPKGIYLVRSGAKTVRLIIGE